PAPARVPSTVGGVMEKDLQDLLALWLGDHDPGEERRAVLLARLRTDADFRRTFVEEVRLLGMLKAVQSPEPRWLRLEDEVGWSARQRDDIEALTRRVVQEAERQLRIRRWVGRSVAAAAAILVAACLYLVCRPASPVPDVPPDVLAPAGVEVATVLKLDGVRWDADSGDAPREGDVVRSGRLRLREGRLTLAFFSGASLTVEGPADLELLAA